MKKLLALVLACALAFPSLSYGAISFTKDYTSANDGETFGGQNLGDIQDDISEQATTFTGNNAFTGNNTYAGTSTFNGNVSGISPTSKHYRRGFTLKSGTTADEDIVIRPGILDVGGTTITATADSSDLDVGTETFLAGATGTDQYIYVYIFSDGGNPGYKLSTEPPDLSFTDDTSAEFPLRYQKYASTYYRCVGGVFQDAAGDLTFGVNDGTNPPNQEGLFVTQFDASNCMVINGIGTGSDQTFSTIWTPKYITVYYGVNDTSPANAEAVDPFDATQQMLNTNWFTTQLNVKVGAGLWNAITTAGTVNAITAQAAGTAGSFTIDAMTDNHFFYAIAYTDIL